MNENYELTLIMYHFFTYTLYCIFYSFFYLPFLLFLKFWPAGCLLAERSRFLALSNRTQIQHRPKVNFILSFFVTVFLKLILLVFVAVFLKFDTFIFCNLIAWLISTSNRKTLKADAMTYRIYLISIYHSIYLFVYLSYILYIYIYITRGL